MTNSYSRREFLINTGLLAAGLVLITTGAMVAEEPVKPNLEKARRLYRYTSTWELSNRLSDYRTSCQLNGIGDYHIPQIAD